MENNNKLKKNYLIESLILQIGILKYLFQFVYKQ